MLSVSSQVLLQDVVIEARTRLGSMFELPDHRSIDVVVDVGLASLSRYVLDFLSHQTCVKDVRCLFHALLVVRLFGFLLDTTWIR